MCAPFSVHDDTPDDTEAMAAFDALVAAERRRLRLALQVAGGATRYGFPRHNADAAISETVGAVTAARHTLDRLIVSRAMGERCVLAPSPQLQAIELQGRVARNEAARGLDRAGPAIVASRTVDGAEASLITMAHAYGDSLAADMPLAIGGGR